MNLKYVFVNHDNENLTKIGRKQKTCIQPKNKGIYVKNEQYNNILYILIT